MLSRPKADFITRQPTHRQIVIDLRTDLDIGPADRTTDHDSLGLRNRSDEIGIAFTASNHAARDETNRYALKKRHAFYPILSEFVTKVTPAGEKRK